ncbi:MAG: DUF2461 domain-containing protein [Bacteroidales bacterium]|nr:DUF2461 domain-containing protein [Bacteroidales bacterium]
MKEIIAYLQHLQFNNNRPWFNDHKDEYLHARALFEGLVERMIGHVNEFDPSIGPLQVKDCTYRIYRDTRFSNDKTPYKQHFGAFLAPQGKKSGFSGYYFQVGADDHGFPHGCVLATGNYYCEPAVLKLLREDIELDEGKEFMKALQQAEGWQLDFSEALKRPAKGFPTEKPYSQYFRLKNFCLTKDVSHDYFLSPNLEKRLTSDLASTKPFLDFINRAIAFLR